MKRTLSVVALLLAVMMIAMCCVACGDDDKSDDTAPTTPGILVPGGDVTENNNIATAAPTEAPASTSIVGKWRYSMQFNDVLAATKDQIYSSIDSSMTAMYDEMFKAFDGVSFDMFMEFTASGDFIGSIDRNTVTTAMSQIKANLKSLLPRVFEIAGTSMDQVEEALAAQGLTLDTYVDQLFSQMDVESSLNTADTNGTYRYEGDRLYTSDQYGNIDESSYAVVNVYGDTMQITGVVGSSSDTLAMLEKLLPITFVRVY